MIDLSSLPSGCTLRLILLRHGQPDADAAGRCYGQLDVGLSEEGREQVRAKTATLSNLHADALYTSPTRRAFESALIVAEKLHLQAQMVPELREINFGAFEGRSYDEIRRLYPAEYNLWMADPTEMRFPDGESFAGLKDRVLQFLSRLRETHQGQTAVVCSHGGVIRVVLAHALGLPNRMIFRIDQSYAAANVIDFIDTHPIVRLING